MRDGLSPLADHISWAFVYGSIARGEETSSSDIDPPRISRWSEAGRAIDTSRDPFYSIFTIRDVPLPLIVSISTK